MEDEMTSYPGLIQRGGVWQVRKRIPIDLRHIDPRDSIRVSLGTTDKREAIRLYYLKLAEITAGFEQMREALRARPFVEAALSTARIEDLGRTAIEGLVRDWWQGRAALRAPETLAGEDLGMALASRDAEELLQKRSVEEGRDLASEVADRLLVEAGHASRPHRVGKIKTSVSYPAVDRSKAAYERLRGLVRTGLEYEARLARDHLTGNSTTPKHAIFNPSGDQSKSGGKTVGNLICDYRAERNRLHGAESTDRKYGLLLGLLEECWGSELQTCEITRQRCVEIVAFIQRLPANGSKKFPELTFTQRAGAAEAGDHARLAPNTVRTYVRNLCALLRWGKNHAYGVDVNTDGLVPTGGAMVERRGMTHEELGILFKRLSPLRATEPHKFWVPALALYTGARAEELCQLRTDDVIEVGGIACLNLTRFDQSGRVVQDKRFKNKHSERIVPLHDELVRAGFHTFVDRCDPDGRLFPALQKGSKGNHSHNMSKWFGRFMDSIGFKDPALVFHSFRHGFRDACRDADIRDELSHALGGWAALNQGQRYGNRGAVPNLHRALKQIRFGDFRLPVALDV